MKVNYTNSSQIELPHSSVKLCFSRRNWGGGGKNPVGGISQAGLQNCSSENNYNEFGNM